jgi:thiamine biosynthesis lipoprotein
MIKNISMQVAQSRLLPAISLVFVLLISCGKNVDSSSARTEYVLGTYCAIDLFEKGTPALYTKLFNRLAELDRIFSANRDDSELARVNALAGQRPELTSGELGYVLECALYFARITGGAFDPTVGPLVKLWDIGTETPRVPTDAKIRAALELVNWRDVEVQDWELDHDKDIEVPPEIEFVSWVYLERQGMKLDLGGVAKGYAADQLALMIQKEGIPRALIDLGGNICLVANRADGKPWHVGIQDPLAERGESLGFVELKKGPSAGVSVVSSGVYERYFTGDNGKRYHHILTLIEDEGIQSPKGYPVENGLLAVTVIAASSMDADALSTSCFILGYEKGLALASARNAEILFIFDDKTIRGSPGAMEAFTLTDDSFQPLY